jgi:hypothetical protein
MGQTVVLFSLLYPSMVKSPIHPSRLFRSGNGGVDLALHVLAPRELRLPLRAIIEEMRRIFLTERVGCAVKQSQWSGVHYEGPSERLVLSMSGHPCDSLT